MVKKSIKVFGIATLCYLTPYIIGIDCVEFGHFVKDNLRPHRNFVLPICIKYESIVVKNEYYYLYTTRI